jgi:hypothetical protein
LGAFDLDPAVVRVGDPLRNREPQPSAAHSAGSGLVGAVKPVENVREILVCNADAGIRDIGDRGLIDSL